MRRQDAGRFRSFYRLALEELGKEAFALGGLRLSFWHIANGRLCAFLFGLCDSGLRNVVAFNDLGVSPCGSQRSAVSQRRLLVDFVFFAKQSRHIGQREIVKRLKLLPQIGGTFVHAYDVAEVNILFAFGNDDVFSTDVADVKPWFCSHICCAKNYCG